MLVEFIGGTRMIFKRLAVFALLLIGCGRVVQSGQTNNIPFDFPTVPPHIPHYEEFGYYADWQLQPSADPARIAITITLYHSLWFDHVTAVISTGQRIDTQLQPLATTAIVPNVPFIIELSVDRSRLQPDNEITIVLNGQSSAAPINKVRMSRNLSLTNNDYALYSNPLHEPTPTYGLIVTLDPAIPTPYILPEDQVWPKRR
ncbi:hypothetical protein ACP8Y2_04335 [Herpetosiphon llansteffanensis]